MILNEVLNKVTEVCCAGGFGKTSSVSDSTIPNADVLDDGKVVDPAPVAVTPTPSVAKKQDTAFTDTETKFEFVKWSDLPSEAHKEAAKALGFDEAKWDADEHSEAWWKHWAHLSEEERKGAETLGWEESAWEHKYEHSNFADLPDHVKRAAIAVGFDATMWDDDTWPDATKDKAWDDLTDDEKRAYTVFGYTKPTWDH